MRGGGEESCAEASSADVVVDVGDRNGYVMVEKGTLIRDRVGGRGIYMANVQTFVLRLRFSMVVVLRMAKWIDEQAIPKVKSPKAAALQDG